MLDVRDLRFTYAGAKQPALHGLSFGVERGEILGLLGPSGAGKSTTQNILIGLLKGYSGQVHVLGRNLAAWGSDYYERIGVAFELPTHFRKLTALENLNYFRALYRRPAHSAREVLAWVGLGDAAEQRVEAFSKGMQNRLSLARALLHGPELLFLDEPTSGLDPVNARIIKELIQAQRQAGTTVLLTTHNMALAEELCDRVAFLVDGAIQLLDEPRALKLRYGSASVQVEYGHNGNARRESFPLAGLGSNEQFLALLRSSPLQTIHSQEASLDDIFVQVTGRRLE
ncbi:MAG: ABC transporter ATP-binding protein [Chloroflexaceae bacterium]|nr:ABC transporter ATP-binding protein [Chloroflexaceae bacterium]